MTATEEVRAHLQQKVVDSFDSAFGAGEVRVVFGQAPEPTGVVGRWARCRVEFTERNLMSLGTRRFRVRGEMVVETNSPAGKGTSGTSELSEAIENTFLNYRHAPLQIRINPAPIATEVQSQPGRAMGVVRVPFQFDEVLQ